MSDKELADKYRAARAEAARIYSILSDRGYSVQINGKPTKPSEDYTPSDVIVIYRMDRITL